MAAPWLAQSSSSSPQNEVSKYNNLVCFHLGKKLLHG